MTPYGVSPTTTSYSTNNLNQYTAVGGTSQSYDANGNLTNNGTLTFKFNYKNLITEVRQSSGGALVAEYRYDASGRRVVKSVNGGIFERYIYADVEMISVLDGSQAWKQDFVFDVTGIDRVLILEQADVLDQDSDLNTTELTRSYYHCNVLGSVMKISTASQAEAASYRYKPFGERTITRGGTVQSSDPLGQNWGYTGRLHDPETALSYYRSRYYDSVIGGLLQRDPMGYSEGPSLYVYCRNAPMTYVDPSGMLVQVCYRTLESGGLGKHAFLRITDEKGKKTDYGFFSNEGGSMSESTEDNEGTMGQKVECEKPTRKRKYKRAIHDTAHAANDTVTHNWHPPYEERWANPTSETGKLCEEMTEAEMEACLHEKSKKFKPQYTSRYSCGDWACDVLGACCFWCDKVPSLSRLSTWGGVVDAVAGSEKVSGS